MFVFRCLLSLTSHCVLRSFAQPKVRPGPDPVPYMARQTSLSRSSVQFFPSRFLCICTPVVSALLLFATAFPPTATGYLQWLLAPSSLLSPFLASAYRLLHVGPLPRLLPRNIWFSLLVAVLGSAVPLHARAFPPPLCMPLMYCDAAPVSGGFRAACVRLASFALSTRTPSWISSQQGAELYAIFCCLRQTVFRRLSHVCVVVDNTAAYYTVLSGKASARNWDRVRLLRRINRLCISNHLHVQLALTPSAANPADPFLRSEEHSLSLSLPRLYLRCLICWRPPSTGLPPYHPLLVAFLESFRFSHVTTAAVERALFGFGSYWQNRSF